MAKKKSDNSKMGWVTNEMASRYLRSYLEVSAI